MEIRRFVSNLLSSNMYVVVENGHGIVIDPFCDISPAAGLVIDSIFLTHEHYDHISGVNVWKSATGAPVICSKTCGEYIQSPKRNLASHFKDFCEIQTWLQLDEIPQSDPYYSCSADHTFQDEEVFTWQRHTFKLFEIPGHSRGSMGIFLDEQYFFSGDSLMENYEIELRLPGGSRKLWREIGEPRVSSLPNNIIVCPGHFGEFALKKEVE